MPQPGGALPKENDAGSRNNLAPAQHQPMLASGDLQLQTSLLADTFSRDHLVAPQ